MTRGRRARRGGDRHGCGLRGAGGRAGAAGGELAAGAVALQVARERFLTGRALTEQVRRRAEPLLGSRAMAADDWTDSPKASGPPARWALGDLAGPDALPRAETALVAPGGAGCGEHGRGCGLRAGDHGGMCGRAGGRRPPGPGRRAVRGDGRRPGWSCSMPRSEDGGGHFGPIPMRRVAIVAPRAALRGALVQVADAGCVQLDTGGGEDGRSGDAAGARPARAGAPDRPTATCAPGSPRPCRTWTPGNARGLPTCWRARRSWPSTQPTPWPTARSRGLLGWVP